MTNVRRHADDENWICAIIHVEKGESGKQHRAICRDAVAVSISASYLLNLLLIQNALFA